MYLDDYLRVSIRHGKSEYFLSEIPMPVAWIVGGTFAVIEFPHTIESFSLLTVLC